MLTQSEQAAVLALIRAGCDRETAAAINSVSLDELLAVADVDETFYRELRSAEAHSSVPHVRCLQEAAKEAKNWRASMAWLERRRPEVYAPRGPAGVTTTQLRNYHQGIAQVLSNEITDDDERVRVIDALDRKWQKTIHATLPSSQSDIDVGPNDSPDEEL